LPPPIRQPPRYAYPDAKSYAILPNMSRSGPGYWGRPIRHGYIFGYKQIPGTGTPGANLGPGLGLGIDISIPSTPPGYYRTLNYDNYKMFQFNPPDLPLTVQMMPVESGEVPASGGNLPQVGVGLASSTLELYFDRTIEIARASRPNNPGQAHWRDLGVQLDLFDLLKVISGPNEEWLKPGQGEGDIRIPENPLGGVIRNESLNNLTGQMFDSVVSGSAIMFAPFAVVFSPNLSIHVQRMTSFAFRYLRFTKDLVPTSVKVEMGLEITNMGSVSYATGGGPAGPTTPPPGVTPNIPGPSNLGLGIL
jgi:hypothetical protein